MKLENIRISIKILLITAVLAVVVIGAGVIAAFQMKAVDEVYGDVINRVNGSATQLAGVGRMWRPPPNPFMPPEARL